MLLLPETVGVNWIVCPADARALTGVIVMETTGVEAGGLSVTVAVADFVESAEAVAIT